MSTGQIRKPFAMSLTPVEILSHLESQILSLEKHLHNALSRAPFPIGTRDMSVTAVF